MVVILSGMVTQASEEQLENVYSPIVITPLGIIIFSRELQLWNAQLPMLKMLSGIAMFFSEWNPLNEP